MERAVARTFLSSHISFAAIAGPIEQDQPEIMASLDTGIRRNALINIVIGHFHQSLHRMMISVQRTSPRISEPKTAPATSRASKDRRYRQKDIIIA